MVIVDNCNKPTLSSIKLISGVVFWLSPVFLLLLQLPRPVERGLCVVHLFTGLFFYFLSIFLRLSKTNSNSKLKEFAIFNLVTVPVCLMFYFAYVIILTLVAIKLYGFPSDIL